MCLEIIYLIYMYKRYVALNNLQWLMYHKTKQNQNIFDLPHCLLSSSLSCRAASTDFRNSLSIYLSIYRPSLPPDFLHNIQCP